MRRTAAAKRVLVRLAVLAMFVAGPVRAADYLFPTDIVGAGEVDGRVTFSYVDFKQAFKGGGPEVTEKLESASLQARLGVGHQVHLGVYVPYVLRDDIELSGLQLSNNNKGPGNASLWAHYRMVGDGNGGFSLAGTAQLDTNSGGDGNQGYQAGLSAGWGERAGWRTYVDAFAAWRTQDTDRDYQTLSAGGYGRVSEGLTLTPNLRYLRYSGNNLVNSQSRYDIGFGADIRIAPNAYLTPQLSYIHYGELDYKTGIDRDSGSAWYARLGWYSLFGGAG